MALIVKDANDTDRYLKKSGDGALATPFSDFANAIGDGRKTVTTAGTRVALSATSVPCKRVQIKAMAENTEIVVVGGATCIALEGTRRGLPVKIGEVPVVIEIDDLNKVYVDSVLSGEGVTFIYEVMT